MHLKFPRRLTIRTLWLKLHLYLALTVGFLFAILGFTGSLSIYSTELDRWLNPELVVTPSDQAVKSLDHIRLALRIEHPKRYGSWTLELPQTADGVITAWFDKPHETIDQLYAPLMVAINPFTAEVISNRFWGQTLCTWLLDLHMQLGMDATGRQLVGFLGLLLMCSVCTGLYLWWPGYAKLASVFSLSWLSRQRLWLDLHRLCGITSAFGLLPLALTGILLSYPGIVTTLFGAAGMDHGSTGREIVSTANPTTKPTTLADAVFTAHAPFPKAQLRRVTTPAGETGVYRINLRQANEINQRHPFTTVWIDRWSGQIKAVRDPAAFSFGETLASWLWPLHTGEALGDTGRFLWFVCGQLLFWLYITGMLRWLYRNNWLPERPLRLAFLQDGRLQVISTSARLKNYLLLLIKQGLHFAYQKFRPRLVLMLRKAAVKLQLWSNKFD